MNFNFSHRPEYDLHESLTAEVISHYGVPVKFVKTEKVNKDNVVFGDFSHMKSNSKDVFDMYMMPETSEAFDTAQYSFSEYGFFNYDNINLFVMKRDIDKTGLDLTTVISNLVVLPNNKVMEITHIEWMVPGINNLFTYNDVKSVYKLTLIPYEDKLINEVSNKDVYNEFKQTDNMKFTKSHDELNPEPDIYPDIESEFEKPLPGEKEAEEKRIDEITRAAQRRNNYDRLDGFFDEIIKHKDAQDNDAEIKEATKVVKENTNPSPENNDPEIQVKDAVFDTSNPDVWNGV